MEPAELQCRRCNSPMHMGFIADNADAGYLVQAKWVEGVPVQSKFFGMNTGTLNIKDRQTFPLVAYRCPICNSVEFFAVSEEQAQDMLLRPASGGETQSPEQLLRGSEAPDQAQ